MKISCYQQVSRTRDYMFWYQQPPRNGPKLVVSTSSWMQKAYEEGYSEDKFQIKRDDDLSVMTIKNVTFKDSAMYFCAASDLTVRRRG